jgi:hypothetical protein
LTEAPLQVPLRVIENGLPNGSRSMTVSCVSGAVIRVGASVVGVS